MRELFRISIILTIICCGAALSLAYVYNITKEPIAYQQRLKKIKAINSVFPDHEAEADLSPVDIFVGKNAKGEDIVRQFYVIKKEDLISGIAFEVTASGYGGDIEIMVGVSQDTLSSKQNVISGIKIVNHSETPGLGANITRENFYKQFAGKAINNTNWALKKNGGDIDQVSGATISSAAVLKVVKEGLIFFEDHKEAIENSNEG